MNTPTCPSGCTNRLLRSEISGNYYPCPDPFHQLPNEPDKSNPCPTCGRRDSFPPWNENGDCIKCARDKALSPTPDSGTKKRTGMPIAEANEILMADPMFALARKVRLDTYEEVLEAIQEPVDGDYKRTVRELVKWLEHELGRGKK